MPVPDSVTETAPVVRPLPIGDVEFDIWYGAELESGIGGLVPVVKGLIWVPDVVFENRTVVEDVLNGAELKPVPKPVVGETDPMALALPVGCSVVLELDNGYGAVVEEPLAVITAVPELGVIVNNPVPDDSFVDQTRLLVFDNGYEGGLEEAFMDGTGNPVPVLRLFGGVLPAGVPVGPTRALELDRWYGGTLEEALLI
jgi:hypothetical protein